MDIYIGLYKQREIFRAIWRGSGVMQLGLTRSGILGIDFLVFRHCVGMSKCDRWDCIICI
jgi:hypothetical protein